jgi:hypothetical protein
MLTSLYQKPCALNSILQGSQSINWKSEVAIRQLACYMGSVFSKLQDNCPSHIKSNVLTMAIQIAVHVGPNSKALFLVTS